MYHDKMTLSIILGFLSHNSDNELLIGGEDFKHIPINEAFSKHCEHTILKTLLLWQETASYKL